MEKENRLLHKKWDLYDTREVVYKTKKLTPQQLKHGYDWAYDSFYSWSNITKASLAHEKIKHQVKHFAYAGGWKKFEPLWNFIIKTKGLRNMLPVLEAILSKVDNKEKAIKNHADVYAAPSYSNL
jgi:hypothetical protein